MAIAIQYAETEGRGGRIEAAGVADIPAASLLDLLTGGGSGRSMIRNIAVVNQR